MNIKYLIKLLILFFVFQSYSQEKEKYTKAKIYYNNSIDLKTLSASGIPVDHGLHKKNVFIESVFSYNQLETAKELGYTVDVLINDMSKHIADRKTTLKNASPCNSVDLYQTPVNFELGSMGGFYTLDEMLQELDDMHTLYPNLITLKSTINNFQTEEGRNIYFVKISDNPTVDENEPEILFTAIHHAREPASMQQLIYYMWYLLENYDTNNEVKAIIDNTQQFFVPIINVDGYKFNETTNPNGGGYWRKNRRNNGGSFGVDNNRNYSYHWGEAGVSGPNGDTYNGTSPFSEVENQAIKWLCEQHQFLIAINNHTYSSLLLYPFGYAVSTPTAEDAYFQDISALMVQQNGYANQLAADLYAAAGDSDDWMYADTSTKNKIYAMTPEIGNAFWPDQSEIIGICKEMMFHNLTAAHLTTNYATLKFTNQSLFVNSANFDVDYEIQRLGLQEPANFTVSIVPVSTNIIGVGNPITHSNMILSEIQNNSISVQLSPTILQGDTILYKLILDNGSFEKEYLIEKIFGSTTEVFHENGNTTNQFSATNWGISQASYYSAPYSLTDSQNSDYANNENNSIILLNTVDLTNATVASVSFYAKWNIEKSWDYVQFEISTDNGNTWVPQCGKYTNNGLAQQGIENEPMYDGVQNNWVKEEIDLTDYLGQHIKFRFQLVSDQYTTADGFYFDELKVYKMTNAQASTESFTNQNFKIYPNPTNGILNINANSDTYYDIVLTDINGKIIIKKESLHNINNIDISKLDKGVYFVTLTSNLSTRTSKIIKK
jgi:hypothetical protein